MRNIRTIVVDDEPTARAHIIRLLKADPDIRLVAECRNGMEALEVLRKENVDLVYLDIQMPQINGFETVKRFALDKDAPFVIFSTAFDRYALKAFDVRAVDYLLKPYDDDRFFQSLARAKEFVELREKKELAGRLMDLVQDHLNARKDHAQEYVIKEKGREYRVLAKDILWVKAEGNYVLLQTMARRHSLRMTMNMLENELDPAVFIRIHRSYIVNMANVRSTRYSGNNEFTFLMLNGKHLLSGRNYKDQIGKFLTDHGWDTSTDGMDR
jgi:two-component system LytT family response regulator